MARGQLISRAGKRELFLGQRPECLFASVAASRSDAAALNSRSQVCMHLVYMYCCRLRSNFSRILSPDWHQIGIML